ncbi:hypothetical protein AAG570_003475 [Ranatra chinensis]|uniref:Uncharacterized protein n=1 Tax=Ranatra chinensis TaxID=642074 RepID=A0ABD0YSB1_9HEMI
MVPTGDHYPDRAFLFAFILASRLFIKPHELLGQISARCDAQMVQKENKVSELTYFPIQLSFVSLSYPTSFSPSPLLSFPANPSIHRPPSLTIFVRLALSTSLQFFLL